MFKQRFQSQTLLACLFNYISGRLQHSSKSGLCFYRLLEFSAFFDPAVFSSVQLLDIEWILLKPVPVCSLIHQGLSGTSRSSSLFSHSELCVTAHSSSQTRTLMSGRWCSSLNAMQYTASASVCDLIWSQLCSMPCLLPCTVVAGIHIQILLISVTAVPPFLFLLFASPVMGKIPTTTRSVLQYWVIWRAELQKYPEANETNSHKSNS